MDQASRYLSQALVVRWILPAVLAALTLMAGIGISESLAPIPFCLIFPLIGPPLMLSIQRKIAIVSLMGLLGLVMSQSWATFPLHLIVLTFAFGALSWILSSKSPWKLWEWFAISLSMTLPPLIMFFSGKVLNSWHLNYGKDKYQFFYSLMFSIGSLIAGYLLVVISILRKKSKES